jgi:hypothetical protein
LNVQLDHLVTNLLPRRALPVQRERRPLLRRVEVSTDDEVGLSFGTFDLDFDMAVCGALFDEILDFGGTAKGLSKGTRDVCWDVKESERCDTYVRREVKPETNGAGNTTFPGSIRPNDHVQMRSRVELGIVVSQKVPKLDANQRPGDEPAFRLSARAPIT